MGLEASHVSYLDELFENIDRQNLNSQQRVAIRALRNRLRNEQMVTPTQSTPTQSSPTQSSPAQASSILQLQINEFLLCTAGVLDDRQFHRATGNAKTPRQQLRYELRKLHEEIIRIQRITQNLQR
jgi:hypothetical protein